MKSCGYYILGIFLFFIPYAAYASLFGDDCPQPAVNGSGVSFETAFAPDEQLSDFVVKAISSAKKSIKVAAHRFVSKNVSIALLNAQRNRKVDVQIVLDKNSNSDGYSAAMFFINMSQPPHALTHYSNQYQDFMVIDDNDVLVGNISSIGEVDDEKKNSASVLLMHNATDLAKRYTGGFEKLWQSSEVMTNKNLVRVKDGKEIRGQ